MHFDQLTNVMKEFTDYWYIDVSLEEVLINNRISILAPFLDKRGYPLVLKTCTTQILTLDQIEIRRLSRELANAKRRLEILGRRSNK